MSKKVIVNIVYLPQTEPAHKIYENEKGEIWNSGTYDSKKINVGMGWYSIKQPRNGDCMLVVEPYCVLPRDYDPGFARKFKHIFTWAVKGFEHNAVKDKTIEINHPTYHSFPNSDTIDQDWPEWNTRANEIVFVANNKSSQHHSELYSLRLLLADILDVRSEFNVSWYGQIPIKRHYYKGTTPDKQGVLKGVKFSVCTENSYDVNLTHNYFTEKMPDVWMAGAVPIYMGCHNVNDLGFPQDSYIDLRDYCRKEHKKWIINKDGLVQRIQTYSVDEYNNYRASIKSGVFKSGALKRATAFSTAYDKIIDTFCVE